ncbi:hypothetical protein AB4Y45_34370 [Paraburkholderia sp. EG287A]|uniref:hypothetical protein n=1 Tax=Paraburkholderia sp. EG287A TaxID=3237012 RepID=UPI0034D210D0
MSIEANKQYRFAKSGSLVRTLAPAERYLGQAMWSVERLKGQNAGKQMQVPARALVCP